MDLRLTRIGPSLLSRRRRLVFAIAALAGGALLLGGQGAGFDQQLRNLRDSLRSHPASGQVAIVEIDARSVAAIDKWPWPRSVHARVIDRLSHAGARSIAFDVDFSSRSDPRQDERLAASLRGSASVVTLPTFRQYAAGDASSSEYIDTAPYKLFSDHAFQSAVNVVPDSDGYVRRMPLGVEIGGSARPSLSTMVAERNAEAGRSFDIDYSIDPATIPRHSVIDLIEGRVPASEIAGKRFIVGATAIEIGDRYAVPRFGVIPGVVIQALGAETLMDGRIPIAFGGLWPLLLTLLLVAVTVRLKRRPARIAAFGLGAAAVAALPLATEAWLAVSMPVAPALFALAVAMLASGAFLGAERLLESRLADEATGLPNLAALATGARGTVNIVVARIERFAAIASSLGPVATATLVQRIADRLRLSHAGEEIYRVDAASLAWIEAPGDEHSLEDRLEAIASLMRSPVECGRLVDVSLAFGLATGDSADAKQLASNAGLAAVLAAQEGVRWRRFVDVDSAEIDWHLSLLGELDAAMASGHVWNAYQPKLDIATGAIVGAEALVRWAHPVRGPIGPGNFIPPVEEAGRIRDLTAHVLRQALDDAQQWREQGFEIGVAVNVSASLLADHEFIEEVGAILQSHKLPARQVTIEVTETAAMASPERAIAALESWRSHGVGISIDDYGTGQSSLNYLQKLPATELKIDMSFVRSIVSDSRNAIMVRSTIGLAHELGMKTVAEGVEDSDCLELLGDMGCDTAQGYFIGKPMSAADLAAFLREGVRAAA